MPPKKTSAESKRDGALLDAVGKADLELVRSWIAKGANLNACRPLSAGRFCDNVGNTPLAVALRKRADAREVLAKAGETLNLWEQRMKRNHSMLLEIMEELARAGADVNLNSTLPVIKCSLLRVAAVFNDGEALQLLLGYGANIRETGALHAAVSEAHVEMVKALLDAGFDPNEICDGRTPLQLLKGAPAPKEESKWEWNISEADREEVRQAMECQEQALQPRRDQIIQMLDARIGKAGLDGIA